MSLPALHTVRMDIAFDARDYYSPIVYWLARQNKSVQPNLQERYPGISCVGISEPSPLLSTALPCRVVCARRVSGTSLVWAPQLLERVCHLSSRTDV